MIKKWLVFVLMVVVVMNCCAQDSLQKKKLGLIVKTEIVSPLLSITGKLGGYSLTVEKMLGKRHSVQITGNYLFINSRDKQSHLLRQQKRMQLIPEYKFFVIKNYRHSCPYIGLFLKYSQQENMENNWSSSEGLQKISDYYLYSYSFGLLNGDEIWIKNKWTIDFLYGHGASNVSKYKIIKYGAYALYELGWTADNRFAINIGYKF